MVPGADPLWWRGWQDLHALAFACCSAAGILHRSHLAHRDLRLSNVVQLGPQQYMVIDLETVAWLSAEQLPQNFSQTLYTCTTAALDKGGHFTAESDMHLIGHLLREAMQDAPEAASQFIQLLIEKRLTSQQAPGASGHPVGSTWCQAALKLQT